MTVAESIQVVRENNLLFPQMTTAEIEAIENPVESLLIYNTDTNAFNYFNGTVFKELATMP